jgi:hypothetical protein
MIMRFKVRTGEKVKRTGNHRRIAFVAVGALAALLAWASLKPWEGRRQADSDSRY